MSLFNRLVEVFIVYKSTMTAVKVDGLNVSFEVEKNLETGKEGANSANVRIYNLSDDTRKQISATGQYLILKVGYKDNTGTEVIYKGDIDLISHKHVPPNVVTHIECQDRGKLSTKLSLSFKAGTQGKNVLRQIISLAGITLNSDAGLSGIIDQVFNQGFAFNGSAMEALNKVTGKLGAEWSLQNGELKLLTEGATDQKRAVVLSPESGLIDSPEREFKKKTKEQQGSFEQVEDSETDTTPITRAKALLHPKLEPGNLVKIVSREFNAFFKIVRVRHVGETFGQDWTSDLECINVKA